MKIADDIIAAVCAEHGVSVDQLRQPGMRTKGIANARGEAVRKLRDQHFSATWIAIFLNMSRQGVNRHMYPNIQEAQRLGSQRYRARQKALRAEASA